MSATAPAPFRLEPVDFAGLNGFAQDDALDAFRCFEVSARAVAAEEPEGRAARAPSTALKAVARAALAAKVDSGADARAFFATWFRPHRVVPEDGAAGFLTGYYEPLVPASRVETKAFGWPLLGRPADLVRLPPARRRRALRKARAPEGCSATARSSLTTTARPSSAQGRVRSRG